MGVKLLPHQKIAIEKMHNGCVLTGGVGTGKTITSLGYYWLKELNAVLNNWGSIDTPKDIYIFTTARKRDDMDWQEWGINFGLYRERDLSAGRIQFTVDSYNNIQKYKTVKDAFIILDEQRMVGSGLWSKTFILLAKSNRWIMLSATPGDRWEDYIPLFVANGFYKNRTEFVREHCVYSHYGPYPKLERYISVNKLVRLRNQILVDMPYERHTTRHIRTINVGYDKDIFEKVLKKRWNPFTQKPLKDVAELYSVMRKVVNSDTSRVTALRDLMQKHPRLIVFYNFNYELEILRTFANSMGAKSSTSNKKLGASIRSSDRSSISLLTGSESVLNVNMLTGIESSGTLVMSKSSDSDLGQSSMTTGLRETDSVSLRFRDSHTASTQTRSNDIRHNDSTSLKTGLLATQRLEEDLETLDNPPPRSSLIEAYLKEYPETPSTIFTTTNSEPSKTNGLKNTSSSMKNGADPDQLPRSQSYTESPSSWSGKPDDRHILKTSSLSGSHGEMTKDSQTPQPKLIGAGVSEKHITTILNGVIDGSMDNSCGTTIGLSGCETELRDMSDPWIDTIWAKDYIPPEGQPDPRDDPRAIDAKYRFDKWYKKQRYRERSWTASSPAGTGTANPGQSSTVPSSNGTPPSTTNPEKPYKFPSSSDQPQSGMSQLQVAEWNGQKHEPVPESENWLYFVQYTAGAEAWNCITTDAMVFYSRCYPWRQFTQAQGRTDRLNTPYSDLFYYDLTSKSYIDLAIGRARKEKRDFNEMSDFKEKL